MAFYSYIFTANYKRFKQNLKKISKEEQKNYLLLKFDTFYSILRYGVGLSDYLNFQFYKRSAKEKNRYAGIRTQNKFYEIVSPSPYKERYTIKPRFLKEFKKYTKRDFFVPNGENFAEFKIFLKRHKEFMSKPYDGLGGADVLKVSVKDIKDQEAYYQDLCEKHIFLEELVVQHKEMSRLCPTSVNTIRIMTFNNHGNPRVIWAGLRVGNGVNSVDNFHAGGMGVNINMKTGKLYGNAIDKNLKEYPVHPTTKVIFEGFQIPYFEEVKELVKEASLMSDKILVVGWDVAITEKGPLIIEGNRRPGFDLIQVLADRGRMDIIEDVLKDTERK